MNIEEIKKASDKLNNMFEDLSKEPSIISTNSSDSISFNKRLDCIIGMLERNMFADDYEIRTREDVLKLMKTQFERNALLIHEIKKLKADVI
jgi:hypothetical protein